MTTPGSDPRRGSPASPDRPDRPEPRALSVRPPTPDRQRSPVRRDVEDPPNPAANPAGSRPTSRAFAVARRLARHEWTLASLVSTLLALGYTWPTLKDPAHTIPQDYIDPTFEASQIAWGGHALLTNPGSLWHGNAFYPEPYSYAFSDTLLGYAPFGMIGTGPEAALIRYNILFVLAHALASLGAYALVRQLGAGRIGAFVAGVAFAYAPWRLAHAGHMNILSSGGIPLALAMLARGHGWSLRHGYRPELRRPGWVIAGWVVAAWQISLGFATGLIFGYLLAGCCLVAAACYGWSWLRRGARPVFGGRLLAADLGGGLFFTAVTLLMAAPYLKITELHPEARRTLADVALFSPPPLGFIVAPAESWLWGDAQTDARALLPFPAEMARLPGAALMALAVLGLVISAWRLRHRVVLGVSVAIVFILALGTQFLGDGDPGFATLFRSLPAWDALRTPGRFIIWITLLLGILAAGALTEIERGVRAAGHVMLTRARDAVEREGAEIKARALRAAVLLPVAMVLAEGVNNTPHPVVPPQPAAMRDVAGPVLVLPLDTGIEDVAVLWVTDNFAKIVNGVASFNPRVHAEIRDATVNFPDSASVEYLQGIGIRTVVLVDEWAYNTPWEDASDRHITGLGITRTQIDNVVVYHLDPSGSQ